jgi:hypothetical protein
MINLHIVTRCSRIQYLDQIYESVQSPTEFNVNWWILFDMRTVEFIDKNILSKFSQKNIHLKFFIGVEGDLGHTYLNEIYSQIPDGYIYMIDDDNAIHDRFYSRIYEEIINTNKKAIAFNQYIGGKDFSGLEYRAACPQNMRLSGVDFAQVVFHKDLTEDIMLVPNYYCADSVFLGEIYSKYPEEFSFVNEVLCYYNYYTNLLST